MSNVPIVRDNYTPYIDKLLKVINTIVCVLPLL